MYPAEIARKSTDGSAYHNVQTGAAVHPMSDFPRT
jgi:hypothetical protein